VDKIARRINFKKRYSRKIKISSGQAITLWGVLIQAQLLVTQII
jgi:hypothetical protein